MSSSHVARRRPTPVSAAEAYARRECRRNSKLGFAGPAIRVEQIAWHDHLFDCAKDLQRDGGEGAGADGRGPDSYDDLELGGLCREIEREIRSREYEPDPYRTVAIPKPGTSEKRVLSIPTFRDRIVGKALQRSLTPFWDRRLFRSCYGYRPERGHYHLLADLERGIHLSKRYWLLVDDVRTAFDTVPLHRLLDIHRRIIGRVKARYLDRREREHLLWLLEALLRGDDRTRDRGIAQGAPYNPVALNVYLHYEFDRLLRRACPHLPSYRYADNLAYLCTGMSEAAAVADRAEEILGSGGQQLKGPGGAVDLGNGGNVKLLGFRVSWQDGTLRLAVENETYRELRSDLLLAYGEPDPPLRAAQVVLGWIGGYAPGLGEDAVGRLTRILHETGFREIGESQIRDGLEGGMETLGGDPDEGQADLPPCPAPDAMTGRTRSTKTCDFLPRLRLRILRIQPDSMVGAARCGPHLFFYSRFEGDSRSRRRGFPLGGCAAFRTASIFRRATRGALAGRVRCRSPTSTQRADGIFHVSSNLPARCLHIRAPSPIRRRGTTAVSPGNPRRGFFPAPGRCPSYQRTKGSVQSLCLAASASGRSGAFWICLDSTNAVRMRSKVRYNAEYRDAS